MQALYLNWYGTALAVLLVSIWFTRHWRAPWRIVTITGVTALGFTTVPLFSVDGAAWYPMGAFYLSSSRVWLETAAAATKAIVVVWVFLAVFSLVFWLILRKLRPALRRPDH